ncbi:MAG: ankyrin repeat domain-containing protein [Bacteroidia bacterium]|nr:ankyrin repeat domain-containing protein [Bacteroidia bacterium]
MHLPDDPKLQEDLNSVESPNYLTRYHACNRVLDFFQIKTRIPDLKKVFPLICDTRYPEITNGPADFQQARQLLLNYIDQELNQPNLSGLSVSELSEQLMEILYLPEPAAERVEALLAAGADPLQTNEKGESAYLTAAQKGHRVWVKRFLEAGADIRQIIPGWKESVFLSQVGDADLAWLKEMAAYGADLHEVNSQGENAVFLCRWGKDLLEKVKWLHSQGVNIDLPNHNGETPFYNMSLKSDESLLRFLAAQGANPNPYRLNSGETALLHAVKYDNLSLVRLLLELGADPEIKGGDGQNAFELAMSRGLKDIVVLLKGEEGAKQFEQSEDQHKISDLKKMIIQRLQEGKSWNSSHKEGATRFWYAAGKYHHSYQEHQSDYGYEGTLETDQEALDWLYNQNKYGWGSETMLKVYEGILGRL